MHLARTCIALACVASVPGGQAGDIVGALVPVVKLAWSRDVYARPEGNFKIEDGGAAGRCPGPALTPMRHQAR